MEQQKEQIGLKRKEIKSRKRISRRIKLMDTSLILYKTIKFINNLIYYILLQSNVFSKTIIDL
jgi:hypothetical protein